MPIFPVALVVLILTPPCPLVGAGDSRCSGRVSLSYLSATLLRGIAHHWARWLAKRYPAAVTGSAARGRGQSPGSAARCLQRSQPVDTRAVARGMRPSQAYANGAVTNRA